MNALLSHSMTPVIVGIIALLVVWLAWKVLKSTVKLLITLAVVAAIVVGILWLRAHAA